MMSSIAAISYLLFIFLMLGIAEGRRPRQKREFIVNQNAAEEALCAGDSMEPDLIVVAKTEAACLSEAKGQACMQFYEFYPDQNECHLYSRFPKQYISKPGCVSQTIIPSLQRECGIHIKIQQNINTAAAPSFSYATNGFAAYKAGFGVSTSESNYWMGLDNLSELTGDGCYKLRVEMQAAATGPLWVEYNTFIVDDECHEYRLTVGDYNTNSSSQALDALYINNGLRFSTPDRDKDLWAGGNCASTYTNSGWWFNGTQGNFYPCSIACPNSYHASNQNLQLKWYDIFLQRIALYVDCKSAPQLARK